MRKRYKYFILVLILFLSIGFAYLTANLNINGSITFRDNVWDVHLDNIVVESDSIEADNPTINSDKDTVNFTVTLTRPGDYYEFYVDVVNAGTMDATLDSTTKTTLTGDYLTNLIYNVTYYSDRAISQGDLLRAGCKERIKVRVEYKYDVNSYTQLNDLNLYFRINYKKTDTHESTYNAKVWDFDSKAEEDTFKVPKTGTYKLEVWGAQGGKSGGYGGYSVGNIELTQDSEISIIVGSTTATYLGGYNGGGQGNLYLDSSPELVGGGGGATHIASNSRGILQNYSNNRDEIIIVAGGGGGTSQANNIGGYGGGYIGGSTATRYGGFGGTQSSTGAKPLSMSSSNKNVLGGFGYGGDANPASNYSLEQLSLAGGGGAGWFGGSGGDWASIYGTLSASGGGGGGSGYIGNTNLTDKIMYCYNCQESTSEADETNIKTRSTTNASETPTSNYAKIGHGYARITFIG